MRHLFAVGLLVLTGPWLASGAAPSELGQPRMQIFTPRDYRGAPLCQAVIQDTSGVMYVANDTDALAYDGAAWQPIKLPPESTGIRRWALGSEGRIYAGGGSVLGYLDNRGARPVYVSLIAQLPESERNFSEIYAVQARGETVYFANEQKIFALHAGKFSVIACPTPVGSRGPRFHRVGDTLYVTALGQPLSRLVGERLEQVSEDPLFRENIIISIEPAATVPMLTGENVAAASPQSADTLAESLLVLTAERGFFQFNSGRPAPVLSEMTAIFSGKRLTRMVRCADGAFAVGFATNSGNGGMRFDRLGRFEGPIDETVGLPSRGLRDFFIDREGGLWIGLESGVVRLDWPSAVTVFGAQSGLGTGIASDVTYHDGDLYVATIEGLHRLKPAAPGAAPRFERILSMPIYSLLSRPDGLLAIGFTEIFWVKEQQAISLFPVPASIAMMRTSAQDPARVWVTSLHGLRSIYATPTGWRDEGMIPGFDEHTRDVLEMNDGSLWLPTFHRGVFHLTLNEAAPGVRGSIAKKEHRSGDLKNMPSDVSLVFDRDGARLTTGWSTDGKDYFATRDLLNEPAKKLFGLNIDSTGQVWRAHHIQGAFWIAAGNGVFRVDLARVSAPRPFAALLRPLAFRDGATLPPAQRDFSFEFAAPRHSPDASIEYQTWLQGYEAGWSAWSAERKRSFTHLPSGNYRFQVRARDADGVLSAPADIRFTLPSPWWQTWWAGTAYFLVGAGAMVLLVRQSTVLLRRKNERLEALIGLRTQDLSRQNSELTRLHQLDLDEKIAARLSEEKSRLEVLRYQLNPHFLFNSLIAIRGQIPSASTGARRSLDSLADFCRETLHDRRPDERVSLGEEFAMLRSYLDIEQARLGELLHVEMDLATEAEGELVPRLLLLPLVENALKYGYATSRDRLQLRIAARRMHGKIFIEIANSGEWVQRPAAHGVTSFGIGLENLRERLQRYYPAAHEFSHASADGWVKVQLQLFPGMTPPVTDSRSPLPVSADNADSSASS